MKSERLPRLLLVEDDPISRAFLTAAAQGLPAEVDGAETLAAAQALSDANDYDLWMFDANLPDGTGAELLARLRVRHARTPALAHTAATDRETLDELVSSGFAEVLVKPLPAETVRTAIRRLLGLEAPSGLNDGVLTLTQSLPVWDDEAAARVLNGNRSHIQTLRGLFMEELPKARRAVLSALDGDQVEAARGELHKLRASCGFVGAARLHAAVQTLQTRLDSPAARKTFEDAAKDTLTTQSSPAPG